ncbi:ParB N-terminal domain-containing protein [Streptosporangium sp. NPDC001559]|uniref:ParB N-terminal domain-containing protein n=1 Tax=Streptosporangium sp. NPDC001559 TaxID=3366187 RepID=UPI0036E890EE
MAVQAGETTPSGGTHTREGYQPELSAVETVPVGSLLPADSPRRLGENAQHIRMLSGTEDTLPPVIVHRETMRVIDGMHRLQAAVVRGEETIRVRFFEGDEHDAFVVAVKENTAHGLPLSTGDRVAAAARILRSHPHWSDRAIARISGLSARKVADIRRTVLPQDAQPKARLGRDGRTRPLDGSAGRMRAAELIVKEPQASLRRIAQQVGISPGTVRDVRDRLRRGEDPLPRALRPQTPEKTPPGSRRPLAPEPERDQRRRSPLNILMKDPSLRSAERGRHLLRLLSVNAALAESSDWLVGVVPEYCVGLVCQVAMENAAVWERFAENLQRRTVRPSPREG